MTTAETDQTKKRNGADWRSVDIVFADGSTGPAKAAYVGDGWCDVAVERGGIFYRLWVRANGEVDLPMNPCRLAKPWTAIGAVSEASGAPETESEAVAEADPLVGLPEEERARILDIADKAGRMFGLDAERMAIAREVAAYCARQSSTCCAWHKSGGRKGEPCARHVATVAELAATPEPLTREETEADPLAGLPEAKRTRILREAGLADGPFSRQRAIAAGIAAFCAQVDILRGSRFTAEPAAHGSAADTLSREEAEKSPAAKAETDLLATVPTEERARIVAVAEKASRDNPFECDRAYEAAVAREVAAWHVAHPVCENGCGRARAFGDYCGDCHNSNEPRWQSAPEKSAALPCPHHPVATERTPACTPADPCPEHRAVTPETRRPESCAFHADCAVVDEEHRKLGYRRGALHVGRRAIATDGGPLAPTLTAEESAAFARQQDRLDAFAHGEPDPHPPGSRVAPETLTRTESADAPQGSGAPALSSLIREEAEIALARLGMGTPVITRMLTEARTVQPTDTAHGRAVGAVIAAFLRGPDAPSGNPLRAGLPENVCSCGAAVGDHEGHPIGKGCDLGASPYGSKHTTAPVRIEYDHGPDGETYRIEVPATPSLIDIALRLAAERMTDDELAVYAGQPGNISKADGPELAARLAAEVVALRAEREEASAALDVEIGRDDKATGRTYSLRERIGIVMAGLREETKRGDDAEDKVDRLTAELAARPAPLTPEQLRAIVDDLAESGDSRTVFVSAAAVRALLDTQSDRRPRTVLDEDPGLAERKTSPAPHGRPIGRMLAMLPALPTEARAPDVSFGARASAQTALTGPMPDSGTNWTPERRREAIKTCDELPSIDAADRALREYLPAAIEEIERLTAEIAARDAEHSAMTAFVALRGALV